MPRMQKTSHILDDRTRRVVRDTTSGQEWLALPLMQLLRVVARQPHEFDRLAPAYWPNAEGIHSAPQGSLNQPLLKRRGKGGPPRQPAALQRDRFVGAGAPNTIQREKERRGKREFPGQARVIDPLESENSRRGLNTLSCEGPRPTEFIVKPRTVVADEGAGAAPGLDQPGLLEIGESLTDRAAADVETTRQFKFTGQPFFGTEDAGLDVALEVFSNAPIFRGHLSDPVRSCLDLP